MRHQFRTDYLPDFAEISVRDGDKETPSIQQEELEKPLPVNSNPEVQPDELIRSGLDFFSDLARTLSSPEATEKLVGSLIEEDKTTGETHLKIPVKDKDCVVQIINLFGKLLGGVKI